MGQVWLCRGPELGAACNHPQQWCILLGGRQVREQGAREPGHPHNMGNGPLKSLARSHWGQLDACYPGAGSPTLRPVISATLDSPPSNSMSWSKGLAGSSKADTIRSNRRLRRARRTAWWAKCRPQEGQRARAKPSIAAARHAHTCFL